MLTLVIVIVIVCISVSLEVDWVRASSASKWYWEVLTSVSRPVAIVTAVADAALMSRAVMKLIEYFIFVGIKEGKL
jgi:hypothetical protein